MMTAVTCTSPLMDLLSNSPSLARNLFSTTSTSPVKEDVSVVSSQSSSCKLKIVVNDSILETFLSFPKAKKPTAKAFSGSLRLIVDGKQFTPVLYCESSKRPIPFPAPPTTVTKSKRKRRSSRSPPRSILKRKRRYSSNHIKFDENGEPLKQPATTTSPVNVNSPNPSPETTSRTITLTLTPYPTSTTTDRHPKEKSESTTHVPTPQEINARTALLFPDCSEGILRIPCVSPRLFACFSLLQDAQWTMETMPSASNDRLATYPYMTPMTHRRRRLQSSSTPAISHMQPLLPLLQAMVELELVSLQEEEKGELATSVSNKREEEESLRKVHFSGFDGASTKPPSDVILGSSDHQQDCIGKLQHVLHETKSLESSQEQQQQVQQPLVCLLSFLESLDTDNDHAMAMLMACAQSISSSSSSTQNYEYQPSRVRTAADFYVHDLQILQSRLWNPINIRQPQPPLYLEQQLVDTCGQVIRYLLRTMLNPVPYRAYWDEKLDTVRISDLIQMTSSIDSTAVEDGSMSSLFSYALRHIYEVFGSTDAEQIRPVPDLFCHTGACWRGLGTRHFPAEYTTEDWEEITSSLWQASLFLAAYNGAKFLHQLLDISTVSQQLENGNGTSTFYSWPTLQHYAQVLHDHSPVATASEDVHLAFLHSSLKSLKNQLAILLQVLDEQAGDCQESLDGMVRRLQLGTGKKGSKILKGKYKTELAQLEHTLQNAEELYQMFPTVHAAPVNKAITCTN